MEAEPVESFCQLVLTRFLHKKGHAEYDPAENENAPWRAVLQVSRLVSLKPKP